MGFAGFVTRAGIREWSAPRLTRVGAERFEACAAAAERVLECGAEGVPGEVPPGLDPRVAEDVVEPPVAAPSAPPGWLPLLRAGPLGFVDLFDRPAPERLPEPDRDEELKVTRMVAVPPVPALWSATCTVTG
jgi:hypothetical protein